MLKCQFFIAIITVFLFSIIFQGTEAHEDMLHGFHDDYMLYGFPDARVFKSGLLYKADASCTAECSGIPHIGPDPPVEFIWGTYEINAYAEKPPVNEDTEPDTSSSIFFNELFDYVSEGESQPVTPTGLWAWAHGNGDAYHLKKVVFDASDPVFGWRFVVLFHRHNDYGNAWEDYANASETVIDR